MHEYFVKGFAGELEKLSAKISPGTKAWAMSRGITSGAAAALMGLALMAATGRGGKSKKEKRSSAVKAALIPGIAGTAVGLGKGFAEKGLEKKFLKMITRGR